MEILSLRFETRTVQEQIMDRLCQCFIQNLIEDKFNFLFHENINQTLSLENKAYNEW